MNLLRVMLVLIVISYGGLTAMAGAMQLKTKKIKFISSLSMIAGGLLLIASIFFPTNSSYIFIMLIGSLLLIQGAAINNGLNMFGRINPRHHAIRTVISIFIVVLFLLS